MDPMALKFQMRSDINTEPPISHTEMTSTVQQGRRFSLTLVTEHYRKTGVAIFTEVTLQNAADGEPMHDVYQDMGTWSIDGGCDDFDETGGGATPSVLKVSCLLPDDVERVTVMNALLEQLWRRVADSVEWWS